MASFAAIVSKDYGLNKQNSIYGKLVERLKSQIDGLCSMNITAANVTATKLFLPYSRTQTIAQDNHSGSWLTCVGNPTNQKYQDVNNDELTERLLHDYLKYGQSAIISLSAPFVVIIYDGNKNTFNVVTDRVGLQHIYFAELADFYIFTTSSSALACVMDVHLDKLGLVSYFLVGNMLQQRTFYKEIKKVDGATWTSINKGVIQKKRYWQPPSPDTSKQSIDEASNELIEKFRRAVALRLAGDGSTSIELTSGLDSRFNLACAQLSGKKFHAWTLGEPDCIEVRISEQLKSVQDFEYHTFSPREDLDTCFLDDLKMINVLTDCETNGLNLVASPCCNRRSRELRNSSMAGLCGEILRGPYYVFFSGTIQKKDKVNFDRFLQLKMLHNICARPQVFSEQFPPDYAKSIESIVGSYFTDNLDKPLQWQADRLYFAASAQHFVGRSCSFNNFFYRQELPYYDNEIIDLSFTLPWQFKKNSMLTKLAMSKCHSGYADVPLSTGLPARPLGISDFGKLLGYYGRFAKKASNRIMTAMFAKTPQAYDDTGIYNLVGSILASKEVLQLLEPKNMASSFLYAPDALVDFVRENVNNGFKNRTQIGLMLSFELLCRRIGSCLKV